MGEATRILSRERPDQTLQATDLVHEAYARLVDVEKAQHWNSRGHYFGAAAEAMRRILVERARRKKRVRHGGELKRIQLSTGIDGVVPDDQTILLVHDALEKLAEEDTQIAEVVRLHFFAGLTLDETAEALAMSRATVYRRWEYARAFLRVAMHGPREGDSQA